MKTERDVNICQKIIIFLKCFLFSRRETKRILREFFSRHFYALIKAQLQRVSSRCKLSTHRRVRNTFPSKNHRDVVVRNDTSRSFLCGTLKIPKLPRFVYLRSIFRVNNVPTRYCASEISEFATGP